VLLKFIFGPAFHLSLQRSNCFTLQLLLLYEIWNGTKVLKDARYGVLGFVVAQSCRPKLATPRFFNVMVGV
jgi:hypothetical protein